jgi:hypothetical protein
MVMKGVNLAIVFSSLIFSLNADTDGEICAKEIWESTESVAPSEVDVDSNEKKSQKKAWQQKPKPEVDDANAPGMFTPKSEKEIFEPGQK